MEIDLNKYAAAFELLGPNWVRTRLVLRKAMVLVATNLDFTENNDRDTVVSMFNTQFDTKAIENCLNEIKKLSKGDERREK